MATNVVTAAFGASKVVRTRALYQWDYGQILRFAGLDLPDAYTVHFSNQGVGGEAKTMVGNSDGVDIPDEYLTTGQAVYAWVYLHAGEDDGETVYAVVIPVVARPRPTEDAPTPQQQGLIEQAIAALNAGVEAAQEAAQAVQDMGVEAETLPAGSTATVEKTVDPETGAVTLEFGIPKGDKGDTGSTGPAGQDGVSPSVSVTEITGGHKVSITDASGTETFDVMDGQNGQDGTDGRDGADGVTFTPSVSEQGVISWTNDGGKQNPASVNIKGPTGATGQTGPAGQDGADGYSPTASVSKSGSTATITITDKSGTTTATVSDGTDGAPGPGVAAGGTDGQMLVKDGSTDYATKWANQPSVPVQDVQVNGTSILDNGVANVPLMGENTVGVAKLGSSNGLYGLIISDGSLMVNPAGDYEIKTGSGRRKPITSEIQNKSVFYALAQAAGDTSQSASSNAVGAYTDAAKVAIQKMLGVYQAPFRLIKTFTVTDDSTGVISINKDDDGNDFELSEVVIDANLTACTGASNMLIFVNTEGSYPSDINTQPGIAISGAIRNTATRTIAHLQIIGGKFFGCGASQVSTATNARNVTVTLQSFGLLDCNGIRDFYIKSANSHIFGENSVITIYGR